MGTKTISIMDDVYTLLVKNKKSEESFSDELRRVLPKRKSIMDFAGAWADLSNKDADDIQGAIKKMRSKANNEILERVKML